MKILTAFILTVFLVTVGYAGTDVRDLDLFYSDVHIDTLATVDFQCNMGVQIKKGLFNPVADSLFISGSFNSWGTDNMMTDPNNDSIYTVSLQPDTIGKNVEFKFRYAHSGSMNWESVSNRNYLLPPGTSTYYAWYNEDSVFVQQYDIYVTFSCNMELERLSGRFNPAVDTVSVNGDFNGWAAKTTILAPNPLNPDLYEATALIRKGLGESIEFKYWYTPNNWESVSNRKYFFTQDDINVLAASFSASYNDGTLDNVINQPCAITLTVNTNGARSIVSGNPFPVVNTVHVAGSALPLQWPNGGWPDADSSRMIKLYDDGTNGDATAGDKIFSGIVTFAAYTPLNVLYKYGINYGDAANNEGGNDNESGFATNHTLQMTKFMTSATTVDTFGTMGVSTLANILVVPPTVQFQCNMSVQIKKGLFVPSSDSLFISGTFNGWGTDNMMTDPNNDSIYTATFQPGQPGANVEFKFRFAHAGAMTWESVSNRNYLLPEGTGSYYAWYNNDSIFVQQYDINMTFSCNMELERLSGRFNPAADTVSVNGDFNGWSSKTTILTPNPLNPDLYEATTVIRRGLGEKIEFKFWYTENNWESVSNRTYTFTQDDINALSASFSASFNDGSLDNVINQPCKITFTVNTNAAKSIVSGNPFPVVNTAHIAGSALPLQWPNGGWPDADSTRVIKLFDDGTNGDVAAGDKIFSVEVTFAAYTPLNVLYKYGINWADAANNEGGNDNEAGFAVNHTLQMTKFMKSATTVDTFGTMTISTLKDPLAVKELPVVPTKYELQQNYPNPFNPLTNITYSIIKESFVTLKVYNVLGVEVATLVSEKQNVGTFNATFDASGFSSGMYFYKLTAGDFVSTKKMILVK
ncbi:MAG: T9SS type A sorting domain-containing protein [Ignavibacteriales bacterium]|nr:T9SS type A sorting domain-containing protein [Ignavibacteriales bacterium]